MIAASGSKLRLQLSPTIGAWSLPIRTVCGFARQPADQVVSGSNTKYAPKSPKIIAIVSTYVRMVSSASFRQSGTYRAGNLEAVPWGTPGTPYEQKTATVAVTFGRHSARRLRSEASKDHVELNGRMAHHPRGPRLHFHWMAANLTKVSLR